MFFMFFWLRATPVFVVDLLSGFVFLLMFLLLSTFKFLWLLFYRDLTVRLLFEILFILLFDDSHGNEMFPTAVHTS